LVVARADYRLWDQGGVTGAVSRLLNGLRANGLVTNPGRAVDIWTAGAGPDAVAMPGADPPSFRPLATASVRTIDNNAAISVTAIARGRWGR
jgi:hypothetical protein